MDKPLKLSVQGSFAVLLIFTHILDKGNGYNACKTKNILPNLKSCRLKYRCKGISFLRALPHFASMWFRRIQTQKGYFFISSFFFFEFQCFLS